MWGPVLSHSRVRRAILQTIGTTSTRSWRRALEVFTHACAYCRVGGTRLQKDHVIPLSRGGFDVPNNVVPACVPCNVAKGDRDFREFMRERGYNETLFLLRWLELGRGG